MPLYDQVELLCQAIATQAKGEVEEIMARAREEAERRLNEAEARRQEVLARTKAEVEAQARLEARSRIDRAELSGKRQVSQTKETFLNEVFAQAQALLLAFRETPDYRDWLRRTLLGTLQQLEGEEFRVMANPEEVKWLTPDLLQEMSQARACRLDLAADPDLPAGGFVVVRADGRVRFDQTFAGIIDRQRETLRGEIARKLWGS
ncbi:MAG: V-type ATP synthase subunit E [Desulfobaccales bacterium]